MATAIVSHSANPWPVGNVQHWEEAGARLESAIAAYLHSCLALEKSTLKVPPIGIDNLSIRLDRRIEYFNTLMTQPLAQSLASVTRTRNQLSTSIYRIPSEILGRVFELAVDRTGKNLPMRRALLETYRTLHHILGVCSVWRRVALAHVPLWTLVPIVSLKNRSIVTMKSANISLERSGQSNLRLVMDTENVMITDFRKQLSNHSSRFRALNLRASSLSYLDYYLRNVLESITPGLVAELSLCDEATGQTSLAEPSYLFARYQHRPTTQTAFEATLQNLRVLRLCNVLPRIDAVSLGNLRELRVQEVVFGPETTLHRFLRALTASSRLETLDLISIQAYEVATTFAPTDNSPLPLSSLKTLFLEDLSCNVIRVVLSNIKPATHRTIVFAPSHECLFTQRQGSKLDSGLAALHAAIQPHSIDTLMLTEAWYGFNATVTPRSLLRILPSLTSIHFQEQHLDRALLVALTRCPNIPESESGLPKLRRIYISCSIIDDIGDQTPFKEMLSSHPIEELVLGGTFTEVVNIIQPGNFSNGDLEQVDLTGPDVRTISIRTWLKENIPKLKFLGRTEYFEFKDGEWKLW